jgi:hypothetical protein
VRESHLWWHGQADLLVTSRKKETETRLKDHPPSSKFKSRECWKERERDLAFHSCKVNFSRHGLTHLVFISVLILELFKIYRQGSRLTSPPPDDYLKKELFFCFFVCFFFCFLSENKLTRLFIRNHRSTDVQQTQPCESHHSFSIIFCLVSLGTAGYWPRHLCACICY